jgi:selenide, water dikinase
MGGEPLFALNVAGFPEDLPASVIQSIFSGGSAKAAEAGIVIAGGHTVTTDEPMYGMSVTGHIYPDRIWTKAGAQPGDTLFLTKPLGAGVLSTAHKNDDIDPEHLDAAIASMLTLNRAARDAAVDQPVSACTDITGYGLLGHAFEMASKSKVAFEITVSGVPEMPGAREAVERGHIPGGLRRNQAYFTRQGVRISKSVDRGSVTLLFDPQTSGGLLFAVPEQASDSFAQRLAASDVRAWHIGRVVQGTGIDVFA